MRTGIGVGEPGKKATRLQMRVLIGIGSREHRAAGHPVRLEMVRHFGRCALACPYRQRLIEFVLVLQTTGRRQKTLVVAQSGCPSAAHKRCHSASSATAMVTQVPSPAHG